MCNYKGRTGGFEREGSGGGVKPIHSRESGKASLTLLYSNEGPKDALVSWRVGVKAFQSEGTVCVKSLSGGERGRLED